ncbi:MAG: M23 family metallopeptidase [Leptospiraceae bacterium]|nr:M23 family metallopeptidase [Leptospiraceae bacterium]
MLVQFFIILFLAINCYNYPIKSEEEPKENKYRKLFALSPEYVSNGFDYPVGKPNAKGYYDAQGFGKNDHLGEDWNRKNANDFGDPVYACSHGIVTYSEDLMGGWGQVVIIIHVTPDGKFYESLYAHFHKVYVKVGDKVKKGAKIGTIGDANKKYSPHLHFEMRDDINLPVGGGYASIKTGYMNPKKFIKENRKFKK